MAMDFKTQAKISVLSVLISGPTAIILAINGYGVWALVTQALLNAVVLPCCLMFSPWLPRGCIL